MAVIAIDLGGTKSSAALVSPDGSVLIRDKVEITRKSGTLVSKILQKQIQTLYTKALRSGQDVSGIGVSVPGIYYSQTGHVWAPNIPGWKDYPLQQELQNTIPDIPVKIDSDRAAYILGETWLGAARGCRNAVFIAVGTGIGAGIMVDGTILRGHADIAGATGWMSLTPTFRSEYTRFGCFEYHASGDGLARVARDMVNEDQDYYGLLRNPLPEHISSYDVFEAFTAGDALAQEVINQAIKFWGMVTANFISLFNPEIIVFGGGLFGPAIQFIPLIIKEAQRWAQPIAFNQVRIEGSKIGGEAGLYGAAKIALSVLSEE
ncbi:MAG: ROK family protein [Candidatus Marinimicrobia bacterium]|nr:ROK family protein [Candidatus Neomarinimicrobiota bacterium]MBL7067007.1 ROK family protein [Candidatus Neomarinimicrobiota bacterium]